MFWKIGKIFRKLGFFTLNSTEGLGSIQGELYDLCRTTPFSLSGSMVAQLNHPH